MYLAIFCYTTVLLSCFAANTRFLEKQMRSKMVLDQTDPLRSDVSGNALEDIFSFVFGHA
jgi:hypothetical protein